MLNSPTMLAAAALPTTGLLGSLTFGLPLLAWGLLAASVPILVHLVFRERAQREVFPAMRFLMASHLSANRAQWLRHLLLMLARVALVVLVVGMLGRFGCTGGAADLSIVSTASPASVVFCIDNSASMGYRFQGQTRVQAAVDWARNLLEDGRLFGPGSQFAIITGSTTTGTGAWREDRRATARSLDMIRPASHNASSAQLLSQAYGLLSSARHPRREVYYFNDLTESSWADSPAPAPSTLTALYIMDVGQDENRNVALSWPHIPAHAIPANSPIRLPLQISAGQLPCEPILRFSIDGKPRGRQAAGSLTPSSQSEIALNIPALAAGAHTLEINLEPEDALAADNTRYAWLIAGDLPKVGLLAADPSAEVARMMQAMIAPPELAPSEQRYTVESIPLENLLTRDTSQMIAIIVADLSSLNGLAWEKLGSFAKSGGTLIVMPGPSTSPNGYREGKGLLPASIESVAACDPPLRPAVSNLSHPYLRSFADLSIDSINDRYAFKRLALGQSDPNAEVIFPFSDNTPALLECKRGKGRVALFAFSPAADWGQFGSQAAPTIVLVHSMLEAVQPPLDNVDSFAAGRSASRGIGDGSIPLVVRSQEGTDTTVIPGPSRLYALPAENPQLYSAAAKNDPKKTALHYSVNVAESESQLARLEGDTLKSRFDSILARVIRPGEQLTAQERSGPTRVNWGVPLGITLICLLLIESSFANRFYRSFRR